MRKAWKRLLDRLRAAAGGTSREGISVRGGLQEPQRTQAPAAGVGS
jgi:hypothetical protein